MNPSGPRQATLPRIGDGLQVLPRRASLFVTCRIGDKPKFNPSQLHVQFMGNTQQMASAPLLAQQSLAGLLPRKYTLTHNDLTSHLFLSIGPSFNHQQLSYMSTQFFRDEITAEWRLSDSPHGSSLQAPSQQNQQEQEQQQQQQQQQQQHQELLLQQLPHRVQQEQQNGLNVPVSSSRRWPEGAPLDQVRELQQQHQHHGMQRQAKEEEQQRQQQQKQHHGLQQGSSLQARRPVLSLHVHCHVSGGHPLLAPGVLRDWIFQREMPLVLQSIRHAERQHLLSAFPELDSSYVWVHFHSNEPSLNRADCWGPLHTAAARDLDRPFSSILRSWLASWLRPLLLLPEEGGNARSGNKHRRGGRSRAPEGASQLTFSPQLVAATALSPKRPSLNSGDSLRAGKLQQPRGAETAVAPTSLPDARHWAVLWPALAVFLCTFQLLGAVNAVLAFILDSGR